MIRISAKAEYAARAILHLSLAPQAKPLQLSEIAREQKVPREFLVQVMAELVRSGLVSSRRGTQGGYKLRFAPGQIHLKQVIEAVDGSIGEFSCKENLAQCLGPDCIFQPIWEKLVTEVGVKLSQIDFHQLSILVREARGKKPG